MKNINFYDVVLDFILMDSFEDLENPPTSIQNVVNNRWLNSSFKETVSDVYFPRHSSLMGNGQGHFIKELRGGQER